MPGDTIDTMHVAWESQRMARDLPLPKDITTTTAATKRPIFGSPSDPPTISGQLMIYDLDETPPTILEEQQSGKAVIWI